MSTPTHAKALPRTITGALTLLLTLFLVLSTSFTGTTLATEADSSRPAQSEPIKVDMRLANIYGFSTNDKSYIIEGKIWITYSAKLEEALRRNSLEPIQLISFYNKIMPWDSETAPLSQRPEKLADGLYRSGYRFNGYFYDDDVDFKLSPFNPLDLDCIVQAEHVLINPDGQYQPLNLVTGSYELGSRANINGYELDSWSFTPVSRGRSSALESERLPKSSRLRFRVSYHKNSLAALFEWILPLFIVMLLTLLAPNICSRMGSERLAIPPTALLTIALMQQAYRESLPSLPYLTYLDKIYAFSYVTTLAIFALFIWSSNTLTKTDPELHHRFEKRIDRMDFLVQIAAISGYIALVARWVVAARSIG